MITEEQKKMIEKGLVSLSTTDHFCAPNVIILNGAKVISENQILVTDNLINKVKEDLEEDPRAVLAAWLTDGSLIYKFKGEAEYQNDGLILNVTQIWNFDDSKLMAGKVDDQ